jgi:DNA-binding MarR family transcriptional regulator
LSTESIQEVEEAKERNLGQLLMRAARYYNEICVSRVQQFEPRFTVAHTRLFPHLDIEGGTRPSDLAKRLGMSKQAINQLLNDLEKMGVVRREPDPNDGRGKLIIFTEEGHKSMVKGLGVLKSLERELSDELTEPEVERTKDTLEQILEFLESRPEALP